MPPSAVPSDGVIPFQPVADASMHWYDKGMAKHTKSSITLPPAELRLVKMLQVKLRAKTKVEVVRRGLSLLRDAMDRDAVREGYRSASLSTRDALVAELAELDALTSDGLPDE